MEKLKPILIPCVITTDNPMFISKRINCKRSISSMKVASITENNIGMFYLWNKKDMPGTFYGTKHHVYIHPKTGDNKWIIKFDRIAMGMKVEVKADKFPKILHGEYNPVEGTLKVLNEELTLPEIEDM